MKAPDILKKSAQHMLDRAATYDKPEGERSMAKTVQAFNAITGRDITTAEGWLMLAVLKQVRAFRNPGPVDLPTWHIRIGPSGAQALCEHPRRGIEFALDSFAGDPRLAGMNWSRLRGR